MKLRIAHDRYLGFEVQARLWWWPFWFVPRSNTHKTIELAEKYAELYKKDFVVKYL